jgi:hypothetical protein
MLRMALDVAAGMNYLTDAGFVVGCVMRMGGGVSASPDCLFPRDLRRHNLVAVLTWLAAP